MRKIRRRDNRRDKEVIEYIDNDNDGGAQMTRRIENIRVLVGPFRAKLFEEAEHFNLNRQ